MFIIFVSAMHEQIMVAGKRNNLQYKIRRGLILKSRAIHETKDLNFENIEIRKLIESLPRIQIYKFLYLS